VAKTLTAGRIGRTTIELRRANITQVVADALVNAASPSLVGGDDVDGWIHKIGGPSILAQCKIIGGCPTGKAVITTAGDLAASYVIHAVAPRYAGKAEDANLLRSAYAHALARAEEVQARSIAFPSLGTGSFGFPIDQAAPIAVDMIGRHASSGKSSLERVIFVLISEGDYAAYERLFPKR
jgi:O-acetyl-ADP-ribose deacetylase (regulator of RNase III)